MKLGRIEIGIMKKNGLSTEEITHIKNKMWLASYNQFKKEIQNNNMEKAFSHYFE